MSERLIIHNFAGIKDIDLSLGKINVLIGPQAAGKSICAKSLYYFKSFLNDLFTAVETGQTKRQFDNIFLKKFETYFLAQNIESKDFLLRYEIDDVFIQVDRNHAKLRLTYSEYFKKELTAWRKTFRATLDTAENEVQALPRFHIISRMQRQFFHTQAHNLGGIAAYSQIFIPAGRSFFAILQSSIFSFLSTNNAIDPFLTEFGSLYESIKSPRSSYMPRDDAEKQLKNKIDALTLSILQGKHVVESGKDVLHLSDGRKISLANSSSGQQEMLPLALILGSIPFMRLSGRVGNVVYIEEPEAHLFPTAQRSIVNLIATIFNESKIPVQYIITTHSPYILAAFNNLIHAGNVSSRLDPDATAELEKIVPEEQCIRSENMRVYSLHNGSSESIISDETGLISTNLLDTVSDDLAMQFDNILNFDE